LTILRDVFVDSEYLKPIIGVEAGGTGWNNEWMVGSISMSGNYWGATSNNDFVTIYDSADGKSSFRMNRIMVLDCQIDFCLSLSFSLNLLFTKFTALGKISVGDTEGVTGGDPDYTSRRWTLMGSNRVSDRIRRKDIIYFSSLASPSRLTIETKSLDESFTSGETPLFTFYYKDRGGTVLVEPGSDNFAVDGEGKTYDIPGISGDIKLMMRVRARSAKKWIPKAISIANNENFNVQMFIDRDYEISDGSTYRDVVFSTFIKPRSMQDEFDAIKNDFMVPNGVSNNYDMCQSDLKDAVDKSIELWQQCAGTSCDASINTDQRISILAAQQYIECTEGIIER
jgi:hypothetical protein